MERKGRHESSSILRFTTRDSRNRIVRIFIRTLIPWFGTLFIDPIGSNRQDPISLLLETTMGRSLLLRKPPQVHENDVEDPFECAGLSALTLTAPVPT